MTPHVESRITRQMNIPRFFNNESRWTFFPFNFVYFLDLTVFNLFSHKGKKSVIFPTCLHPILNMCKISSSSFTYSWIKAEFVMLCCHLILPSFHTTATLTALFLQQDCVGLNWHRFQNKIHYSFNECEINIKQLHL